MYTRYRKLDILRGIFILGMIFFHTNYMLVNYFWSNIFENKVFWILLQSYGKIGFLILSWISFSIVYTKQESDLIGKYVRKILLLSVFASIISLVSYILVPDEYIFFGILHYFAVSYVLLLLFRCLGYMNLILWAVIIFIWNAISGMGFDFWYLAILWLKPYGFSTLDYFPIFPNLWFSLIGYSIWLFAVRRGLFDRYLVHWIRYFMWFEKIWKHSLAVYLLHAPIIFIFLKVVFLIYSNP